MLNSTSYEYDGVGNKTAIVDQHAGRTIYTYDVLNRLVKVTDPTGIDTNYVYDSNNNLISQTDGEGRITSFVYDNLNRKIQKIDGRQKVETYSYDANDNLVKKIDRNNVDSLYEYDSLNRLVKEAVGSIVDQYSYDPNGNRTQVVDSNGTTSYTYDSLNRVTAKNQPKNMSLSYQYDNQGNKTKVTDMTGQATNYTYDKMNRMSTVATEKGTTTYTYDPRGNRESVTLPNGNVTTYEYDSRNLLTKMTNIIKVAPTEDQKKVQEKEQTTDKQDQTVNNSVYDQNTVAGANYASVTDTVYGSVYGNGLDLTLPIKVTLKPIAQTNIYQYGYNSKGLQVYKAEPKGVTNYEYDVDDRLTKVTEPNGKITSYTYDKASNRKTQTVRSSTTNSDLSYNYDEANRLVSTVEVKDGKTTATNYTYDDNGNQTKVVETSPDGVNTSDYKYDELNQLVLSKSSDGTVVASKYDADGFRIEKISTVSESVYGTVYSSVYGSSYLYDGMDILLELDDLGNISRNVLGINLIGRTNDEGTSYYIYNGHRDVVQLTDETGVQVNQYDYDEFGNPTLVEENRENPYRYSGYYYDRETGYYYLKARFYDPETGRFITEDTYTGTQDDPLSLNLYTYCQEDPIDNWDPDGHAPTGYNPDFEYYGKTSNFNAKPMLDGLKGFCDTTGITWLSGKIKDGANWVKKKVNKAAPKSVKKTYKNTVDAVAGFTIQLDQTVSFGLVVSGYEYITGQKLPDPNNKYFNGGKNAAKIVSVAMVVKGGINLKNLKGAYNPSLFKVTVSGNTLIVSSINSGTSAATTLKAVQNIAMVMNAGKNGPNKPINRPSWKKVDIDMEEVISGHTSDGTRAKQSGIKDLFKDSMSQNAIEKDIRTAYKNAKQVGSPQFDGVNTRIKLQGKGNNGIVEMWYNVDTKVIETAYPIYGTKVKIK
jgi:RHS repeat-associated protein